MFICTGESEDSRDAFGSGETIEQALMDWAQESQLIPAIAQFTKWGPDIYEANPIKVEFNCTIRKTE